MINLHSLNWSESLKLYKKMQSEVKECYQNIFEIVLKYNKKFATGKWKIAYGYLLEPNLSSMIRHCFIINENNEAIDPTLYTYSEDKQERDYISFKLFDSLDEYEDMLRENDLKPDLVFCLMDLDLEAEKWASENEFILIR
ncbi:hypothetical protein J2T17_006364 [Paenibacillus mucilaginosus]|uniref:hypothetical protein n=1 Tax=Paenibacillus mucilaginosus TaxID=61624 RepID=UPI003D1BF668